MNVTQLGRGALVKDGATAESIPPSRTRAISVEVSAKDGALDVFVRVDRMQMAEALRVIAASAFG